MLTTVKLNTMQAHIGSIIKLVVIDAVAKFTLDVKIAAFVLAQNFSKMLRTIDKKWVR